MITFLASCAKDEVANDTELDRELTDALVTASNGAGIAHFVLPKSNNFAAIPQDPKNPLSPVKIELGKLLYHETAIGTASKLDFGKGTYSCASCHFASAGFQAGRFQGIAEGGTGFGINGEGRTIDVNYPADSLDVQPVRTPTALNTAYQELMLWNGQFGGVGMNLGTEENWTPGTPKAFNTLGYQGLETQAIAGLKVHRMGIEDNPVCEEMYDPLFQQAFPDFPVEERVTRETAGLAIAAYERTLLANEAPFQKWLDGDKAALSDQEKRGALVFFRDANCSSCHNGPALNSMEFHALGMKELRDIEEPTFQTPVDDPSRLGRGGFTGNPDDNYKFKVPQLYNLANSPFYGHGASLRSIREVVEYKNNAIPENDEVPQNWLAEEFVPQNLTETQIEDLVVFLTSSLNDPSLMRYQPNTLPSGQCTPNNDQESKSDLGCN